jgi:FSR family fosmidomycin resistance protein-like MFS transporter
MSSVVVARAENRTAFHILGTLSFCHLLNDMVQSLLPAVYPLLKASLGLTFGQVGLITLCNQVTASLLQPILGHYTDRRPHPHSLMWGMAATLAGILLLAMATTFHTVLFAAALVGLGSAVFHPESSRIARLASGGRHGFAQSLFQVGGNAGSSMGPLLVAFFVLPHGQMSLAWFSLAALLGMAFLWPVGGWYRNNPAPVVVIHGDMADHTGVSARHTTMAIAILLLLIFSKYLYLTSLTTYYTFYLITRFHLTVQNAQVHLFFFLGAIAAGTIIGGPVGDRIGRRRVILWSILGVLPFTLALPFATLFWTSILSVIIGVILASAFSAIVVYALEFVPGRVGMISGLFFGVAFGVAGIGAALLGKLADVAGIMTVYRVCSLLPAIGLLGFWLPAVGESRSR